MSGQMFAQIDSVKGLWGIVCRIGVQPLRIGQVSMGRLIEL